MVHFGSFLKKRGYIGSFFHLFLINFDEGYCLAQLFIIFAKQAK